MRPTTSPNVLRGLKMTSAVRHLSPQAAGWSGLLWEQEVMGSTPIAPTNPINNLQEGGPGRQAAHAPLVRQGDTTMLTMLLLAASLTPPPGQDSFQVEASVMGQARDARRVVALPVGLGILR